MQVFVLFILPLNCMNRVNRVYVYYTKTWCKTIPKHNSYRYILHLDQLQDQNVVYITDRNTKTQQKTLKGAKLTN